MNVRQQRLKSIVSILKTQDISNQDELQKALISEGIIITQATLSRDLKHLNVAKVAQYDGTYRYVVSDNALISDSVPVPVEMQSEMVKGAVIEVAFSGQFAVVKTRPGYANAVAYDIDVRGNSLVLGTIAGDDTILVIPREGYSREMLGEFLENLK